MLELAGGDRPRRGRAAAAPAFTYAQAPVDTRNRRPGGVVPGMGRAPRPQRQAGPVPERHDEGHAARRRMEQALRTCTLWLWLDLRFPGVYGEVDEVMDLRSRLNDGIERAPD